MTIAASRQQIALALLLLEAGHVVSVDRIIDALWGDKPPRTAKSQVQITISALRRLLGESAIVTRPPGYLIRASAETIDLARFEELTAAAARAAGEQRFAEAVRDYREALALWRGPALEGLNSEAIQSAATRLNEWRISTHQDCLELELRLGRHHEIIGELTELVAEHPLNEHLRGRLILALYRAGRQADALETFRVGRVVLQEELGIDPCAELCRLEQAILSRDARIDLPSAGPSALPAGDPAATAAATPVPRQLPRTIADFGGREEILERVSQIVAGQDASSGSPDVPVVVLTGRGGVGKTALAVRAAHLLSSDFPDGQLFLQLGPRTPDSSASLVERLLRSLRLRPDAMPPDLEGRAAMFRSALAGLRVLIVIDGAVRNDDITPFLPGTRGCAAIVTCGRHISQLEGVHQIHVGPLDESSASDLLMTLVGERRMNAEPEAARELVRLCEGIPMALRVASAKLRARPHWPISHMVGQLRDETRRLDELSFDGASVRASIAVAYDLLDEPVQRLLRRLSLVDTADFASWVGAPLLDTDLAYAEYLFQQLVAAHLVEPTVTGDGVIRFRLHDLVRIYAAEQCAADESTADRLDALRRLLRCWLFLATTAHRRIYGGDFAIVHGTAEHWPLPECDLILQNPLEWFRTEQNSLAAVAFQAARIGMDELCWDLSCTAAMASESSLRCDDWRDLYASALSVVRGAGNKRGEAALLYSLGTLETGVKVAAADRHLTRSLKMFDELDDRKCRAMALSGLAHTDALRGYYDKAMSRYLQAISGFREIEDLAGEAHTLTLMAQISADRREYATAESMLNDAFLMARKLGAPWLCTRVDHALAELQLRRGHAEPAADTLASVLRSTRETGDVVGQAWALVSLGCAQRTLNDFGRAESALGAALDLVGRTGNRLIRGRVLLEFAELHVAKGERQSALTRVEGAVAVFRKHGAGGVWHARALELLGRVHAGAGRPGAATRAWGAAADLARGTDPVLAGQVARSLARVRATATE
ncbi:AfsR/SARP family transcriptional regulator [Actinomadura latina]|uniref:SARP family transcriptional regulator n=1 Tax=Actinomadura latina TaxID=163603 RepID=A0A846YZ47_9ACTN|nr:AfsR/SARP family transcriptional regulator [Actinomadura latina]NKZ03748.1 SARP family transcriptional regulator [Actinomadura latina]